MQSQSIQVRSYNAMFRRTVRVPFDPVPHKVCTFSNDPRGMENRFDLHENDLVYQNYKYYNDRKPSKITRTKSLPSCTASMIFLYTYIFYILFISVSYVVP